MPTGTVKFFNAAKGFGFIQPDHGGAGIFVHFTAVEASGLKGLNDGEDVSFEVHRDPRSGKVTAVDLAVTKAALPWKRGSFDRSHSRSRATRPRAQHDGASAGSGSGVVKWFNFQKGFGFIQPDGGGVDVFVHISAVRRAGIRELNDGQPVSYELQRDRRSGKVVADNLRIA